MIISVTTRRRFAPVAATTIAAALAIAGWHLRHPGDTTADAPAAKAPHTSAGPWIQPGLPTSASPLEAVARPPDSDEGGPVRIGTVRSFRADPAGELVLDAGTVVTLEQLVAFSTPEQFTALVLEAAAGLSPLAQAQALELARRFECYQAAVHQRIQPDQAPLAAIDLARDLQALQVLRHDHFGGPAALQLFGDQEAVAARLIELMMQDTQVDVSMEERAARAQARLLAERHSGPGEGV